MGRKRYDGSAGELRSRMDAYFAALEDDPDRRGGPSDLLSALGLDMETARRLCEQPSYREHARVLKEAATRLRGHLETAPAWAGSNGSKAMFLARQTLWDGLSYQDKKEGAAKAPEIHIRFGGGEGAFD